MSDAPTKAGHGASEIFMSWLHRFGSYADAKPWELALATQPVSTYPGGSKERVRKAGNNVRLGLATADDLAVIDLWRAAHRQVLNTFQAILRIRTKNQSVLVAQRHKRKNTIFGKLHRFPTMALPRMDDVAGCRLIFDDLKAMYEFRDKFHKAKFKHKRKNEIDRYDYVKTPNPLTGYRGIHDIYEYDVNSKYADQFRGLMIEIQYRTRYQHAWATCVEVIGFITDSQPKFKEGDKRFQEIMQLASEIIARAFEDCRSSLPNMSDDEVIRRFTELDEKINFIRLLRGLSTSSANVSKERNTILKFSRDGNLKTESYRDATEAIRALFRLENSGEWADVVLVRADTREEVREAFKNYFTDATDFLNLIDEGCGRLSKSEVYVDALDFRETEGGGEKN